jgi:hypothetical protein
MVARPRELEPTLRVTPDVQRKQRTTGGEMGALSYVRSYFGSAAKTTLNVALYAATLGRFVLLEGRVSGGIFENWAGRFRYRAQKFARPTTEAEIVDLVKGSQKVRVFGSGHSFNEGVVSEERLVSLDDYSGVVPRDRG